MGFALTGLGPFFAKHSQGDALGFRMAPRWGSGRWPVSLCVAMCRRVSAPFSFEDYSSVRVRCKLAASA
jgi:hypothetical protein